MVPVARRNLLGEKIRLAMSVAGVAFAVLLILLVVSLYRGWSNARAARRLPGDVWVAQAGTRDPFHSASLLPSGGRRRSTPCPACGSPCPCTPAAMAFDAGRQGARRLLHGARRARRGAAARRRSRTSFLPPRGGVVVDRVLAGNAGARRRRHAQRARAPARVDAHPPRRQPALPARVPQRRRCAGGARARRRRRASTSSRSSPEPTRPRSRARRRGRCPGTEAHTSEAVRRRDRDGSSNEGFLPVVGVLVAIGFLVGGAVIALTTYTATIEKARDFGVLKAIGRVRRASSTGS